MSYTADYWSLGIMIFQFLVGKTPFKGQTEYITFENIINKDPEFPAKFPSEAKDLISKLLAKEPASRIGSNSIEEIKEHPFFNDINFSMIRET